MNTATGVTPNNPNDTILKNNNQLISIKNIQNLYIYDFKYISNFVNNRFNVNCFINVTKNNIVKNCLYIYISML